MAGSCLNEANRLLWKGVLTSAPVLTRGWADGWVVGWLRTCAGVPRGSCVGPYCWSLVGEHPNLNSFLFPCVVLHF